MHINVEHREDYAVLHLRGEFDTYYCRHLQEEVDALIGAGTVYAILNLRMVKFINSTALGAIIKASKAFVANGGKMALSRPSPFCREIIGKVGLDRVVPLYEEDEEAARQILSGTAAPKKKGKGAPEEDESSVLFTPADPERIEHFLSETRRISGRTSPRYSRPPKIMNAATRNELMAAGLNRSASRLDADRKSASRVPATTMTAPRRASFIRHRFRTRRMTSTSSWRRSNPCVPSCMSAVPLPVRIHPYEATESVPSATAGWR